VSDAATIAKRHLLAVDGMPEVGELTPSSVQIVVHDDWAASAAGQFLVICLVNLLVRQAKFVSRVSVLAKTSALQVRLPSGRTIAPFPECLPEIGLWAVLDAIPVSTEQMRQADFTIFVGPPLGMPQSDAGHALAVVGAGWLAWIGDPSAATDVAHPRSKNPLGPFLAASLASGEIYKRVRGIRRGRYLESNGYSLWSGQSAPDYLELEDGPELVGLNLQPLHIAGLGAVGNGLAYIIANADFHDPYIVLIDDDSYDGTNLNRCVLAGWVNLEQPKVQSVSDALNLAGVPNLPFKGTVRQYLARPITGLRQDVAEATANLEFHVVASCVDKGISRHDVQGLHPKLLLGGSTLDLKARANVYSLWPGAACLGCHNPAERDGEKLRALEKQLNAMPPDERRRFLEQNALDSLAIEQHLAEAKCGTVGEAALRDFASRSAPEFSVGFVSLGASLLLASALFRHTLFADSNSRVADMTTLNYLNGGFSDAGLSADHKCELGCRTSMQT